MSESENESGDEFEEKMDENDKDPDQEPESDEDLEGLEKALQGKELKFISLTYAPKPCFNFNHSVTYCDIMIEIQPPTFAYTR